MAAPRATGAPALADPADPHVLRGGPRDRLNRGLLWFLRTGIAVMLVVAIAVFYGRYHQTDEQAELVRYVEADIVALESIERPIVARIDALLGDKRLAPEDARKTLVDEVVPQLVRLRKLADAPLRSAKTAPVQALAREYLASVEGLIDACRTAVRVIDDPKLAEREGMQQVLAGFRNAAAQNQAWRAHVADETLRHKLRKGAVR